MLSVFRLLVAALVGTIGGGPESPDGPEGVDDAAIELAQAPEAGAPARPADAPEAPEQEEGDEDPSASVAPSRFVEVGQEHVSAMRNALTKGLEELRQAREKKDAVELTCVNEHVTAMKGILRVSEDAVVALQEAVAASDQERSRYEFRKIHVSKRKMDDLLQAAVNCAGADASTSNTSVEMEIDESLAIIDPYYGDTSFFFDPASVLVDGNTGSIVEDPPTVVDPPPPASDVLF